MVCIELKNEITKRKRKESVLSKKVVKVFKHSKDSLYYLNDREIVYSGFTKYANYMVDQESISAYMRAILVDWMNEVCSAFRLKRETFHYAIHYLDRYLEKNIKQVKRSTLQLIGTTALLIACKLEEVNPPGASDLVQLTQFAYTVHELVDMEFSMILNLNWRVYPVTVLHWVVYFIDQVPLEQLQIAFSMEVSKVKNGAVERTMMLVDLYLLDIDSVMHKPSEIAKAAYDVITDNAENIIPNNCMRTMNKIKSFLPKHQASVPENHLIQSHYPGMASTIFKHFEDAAETSDSDM